MPVNTDGHSVVGGYVLAANLDIGDTVPDDATQWEETLNPEERLYTVRFYGRNGELIDERQVPVEWSETEVATMPVETTAAQAPPPSINDSWEMEIPAGGGGIPYLTYDGNGLNYYNEDGELLWRADGTAMYTQGVSSADYPRRNYCLNIGDLNIDEWTPVYDADTRLSDDAYRMYLDATRESAEDYLRMTYGTRTELREDFIRRRSRYLDEIFLKGDWGVPEQDEQPDIKDERGGALDEFLEKFTPQKTTTERSDEQK